MRRYYVVVIYLLPPPEKTELAENYITIFMGQSARQDFRVIRLWDVNAVAALALNNPALIPFIPLMKGGDNEQILRHCVTRAQQEPDGEELVAVLALLADLVMDKEIVRRIVGLNMQIIKESSLYYEITETARQEGIEQGIEQGLEQGLEQKRTSMLDVLRRLLTFCFGDVPNAIELQLQTLDVSTVDQLTNLAFTVATLEEFEQTLQQVIHEKRSTHGE